MPPVLKILLVENVPADAELLIDILKKTGLSIESRQARTAEHYQLELALFSPDLILSEFALPFFDGFSALRLAQEFNPDIPFIFVSRDLGEPAVAESLQRGATDYVCKNALARFTPSVQRALQTSQLRAALQQVTLQTQLCEERLDLVTRTTHDALWDWDLSSNTMWWNEAFKSLLGFTSRGPDSGVQLWEKHVHPEDAGRVLEDMRDVMASNKQAWSTEYRFAGEDDSVRFVLDRGQIIRNHAGQPVRMTGTLTDLTQRRRSEAALLLQQRALESSQNPILIVDSRQPDAPIIYVNSAFEKVTGYSRDEAIGRNCRFLQGDDHDQPDLEHIRVAIKEQRDGRALLRNYRKNGSLFWNEIYISPVRDTHSGLVTHFIGIQNDITELKCHQAALERQAHYDALTGLANRDLMNDRVHQALAIAKRMEQPCTVMCIGLDNFKFVNDSLGPGTGDELLRLVANRLLSCVRGGDTVARVGGDEFVIALNAPAPEAVALRFMERLSAEMSQSFLLNEQQLHITCSTGLAIFPKDGQDADTLQSNANMAMHRAKALGRNNFQFYSNEMNVDMGKLLTLRNDLWHAMERNELLLHYQPQVDVRTGEIVGMEALIRWCHPRLGMLSPAQFIPLAEENGLILPIGRWVIETACRLNKQLQDTGCPKIHVAVNLSARQFHQKELASFIRQTLDSIGLESRYLELEVTESVVMHNVEEVTATLTELSGLGVQISLDDFGTGYSSLGYLKRFPVNRLKIDQTFVKDIVTNSDDAAIVKAVITLAHGLRIKVTAEGVETAEQLELLAENSCNEAQGYYFSKPVSASEIEILLRAKVSAQPS